MYQRDLLAPYDLGSSDAEGRHSLILDRTERTLYVAACADARTFLAQQWPKTEPVSMTHEEWTAMVETALKHAQRSRGDIDVEEINRRLEELLRTHCGGISHSRTTSNV